jgi:ABC-type transport system involved in multi-copper enzyme maturation permease subunit
MNGIFADTLVELKDRKIVYLFAFVTVLAMLVIFIGDTVSGEFDSQMGGLEAQGITEGLVSTAVVQGFSVFMTILVFLAAMATAGLIPAMVEKGRSEFYLARPISRTRLLLSRVLSIWLVYGLLNIACGLVAVVFSAFLLGSSDIGMIWLFGIYWLNFFIWFAAICLGGILFRSASGAIMMAFLIWLLREVPGLLRGINQLVDRRWLEWTADTISYLVPDSSGMGDIAVALTMGQSVTNWMPLWHSSLVAVVMLLLAVWVFKRRDY